MYRTISNNSNISFFSIKNGIINHKICNKIKHDEAKDDFYRPCSLIEWYYVFQSLLS